MQQRRNRQTLRRHGSAGYCIIDPMQGCTEMIQSKDAQKRFRARTHVSRFMKNKEVYRMLRLSVNKDEYLMVGKNVRITFLGGNGNSLKLMIDAPKEINVARGKAIEKRLAETAMR